jgi:hypothetical protein
MTTSSDLQADTDAARDLRGIEVISRSGATLSLAVVAPNGHELIREQ